MKRNNSTPIRASPPHSRAGHSCCGSWTSAATSRCGIFRCRTRRIRRSACAACAPRSRDPDLLRTQLRAALRVEPSDLVRLLDAHGHRRLRKSAAVRTLIDELSGELRRTERVELGAMIETPAAALTAATLAAMPSIFCRSAATI